MAKNEVNKLWFFTNIYIFKGEIDSVIKKGGHKAPLVGSFF